MQKVRLSGIQLGMLFVGFLYGSSSLLNPAFSALQDGWLAFLIGWMLGIIIIAVYISIYLLNPSQTLIGILKSNFGRFLGTVIGILYAWYFLHLAAIVLRDFGEFSLLVILPNTPLPFIIGCFAALCVYSLKKGIEVTARTGELLIPLIPLASLIVTLGIARLIDFSNIKPVLANGIKPVLTTGFGVLSFPFGETVCFLMVFPLLRKRSTLRKTVFISTVIAGLLLLIIVVRDILALNPQLTQRAAFPAELASKLFPVINIYPLILLNLLIGGTIKVIVCLYASAAAITELSGLSDYKALLSSITGFSVTLSIWLYDNVMQMFEFAVSTYPYYALPFQIIIPVLLLIISIIRRTSERRKTS
ncbi:MAG TPA: endospore germination permease [Clostridiales bacterium]|nr:endospore germination permease [Clostridiales bacterium]